MSAITETVARLRTEAEREYAFNLSSPYAVREAKGMIRAVKAMEEAIKRDHQAEYGELASDFGKRLKMVRISRDMNQTEFAECLSYSKSAISAYEKGEREPTTTQVKEFAERLGVPFEWLCGWGRDFPF